jgi:Na+/phosphate symporter
MQRVLHGTRKAGLFLLGMLLFVLALHMLKTGAATFGQTLMAWLNVSTASNALGFGWLLAYVFLSGSPVAAVAISFFASGTITGLQTFTMITGSRLGASFIVLLVGLLYYLRGKRHIASISTGVLAFLVTAFIYIPALIPGYWLLHWGWFGSVQINSAQPLDSWLDQLIAPLTTLVSTYLSDVGLLVGGAVALVLAFQLLDRALPEIDAGSSPFRRIGRLIYRPITMFALGAVVTSLTLSVSVSIGVLVPLSVKGLVRRENIIPYIMGANITTFIDTLVAAVLIGGSAAFTIVLVEMVSVTLLSIIVLVFSYRLFERSMLRLQEVIISRRRNFAIFLGVMLVVPLVLLLL